MNKISKIFNSGIIIVSLIFCQTNQDARMLGLNGSYTTLARGYQSIGVNPANLGIYKNWSMNILNLSMGLSNNFFSIANYNAINGAHLEDESSINHYPGGKSQFFDLFGGRGIRLMQTLKLPLPIFNLSTRRFAFTNSLSANIDMGLPNGLLDLLLYGNAFGKDIS
ncbi:uncharacterized protein METZ01_LOCUS313538, partial [marine metagenome]